MPIVKIADGAFFVPSYSTQTITPAYDIGSTIQALTPGGLEVGAQTDDVRQPLNEPPPLIVE
jgi:hypothetical protein